MSQLKNFKLLCQCLPPNEIFEINDFFEAVECYINVTNPSMLLLIK